MLANLANIMFLCVYIHAYVMANIISHYVLVNPHLSGSMDTLAQRVAALVTLHGTVNRAAAAIGIPQRTLARIVSGENQSPRADTIRAICAYYGASSDWLLYGTGPLPKDLRSPEERNWTVLVDSLDVDASKALCLKSLVNVGTILFIDAMRAAKQRENIDRKALVRAAAKFNRTQQAAWQEYLTALIDIMGLPAVRDLFYKNPIWLAQYYAMVDQATLVDADTLQAMIEADRAAVLTTRMSKTRSATDNANTGRKIRRKQ